MECFCNAVLQKKKYFSNTLGRIKKLYKCMYRKEYGRVSIVYILCPPHFSCASIFLQFCVGINASSFRSPLYLARVVRVDLPWMVDMVNGDWYQSSSVFSRLELFWALPFVARSLRV